MAILFRRRHSVLSVLALAVCLVGSAAEQDADSLRSRRLGEVRVSGSSKQRAVGNSAPEQVLTVGEMEQMGVQQLSDAVRHMAGVTLHDYGGAGGLKTVSIRGLGAQFTGVSYDGVALSDIQTGQIDLQRYTLNGIKQVDLLIGEGNDIFIAAREAVMPSLLSIDTQGNHYDDSRWHLTAQGVLGSWGYTNPSLAVEKTTGHLAMNILADYVYAENDYPFTIYNIKERIHKHRVHSLMNQGHAEINTRYAFNDSHALSLKLYYYDNDRQLPGVVRYYTSESKQQLRERTAFGQLQYKGTLSSRWAIKAAAKWNWANSDYSDKLYSDGVMDGNYWQREGYLTAAALWRPLSELSLSYASDYIFNSLNCYCPMAPDVRPSRTSLLNTFSARWNRSFFSLSARLLHSVYLNDAERGQSADNYHHWSPSISGTLRFGHGWQARVMWKDIFRMPSFNELYFYHRGTPNLKPERTRQWNVGLTWQGSVNDRLSGSVTLDGYINQVRDKIVCIPFNLFISRNVNAAKVTVKGVDLSIGAKYTLAHGHALEGQGHYSYIHAADRSSNHSPAYGKQIPYLPEHSYSAALTWHNPWVNLTLTAYGVSQRWATNEHTADTDIAGYSEFGTTLFREFQLRGRHRLTASLNISNLLNKQYEVITAYPMPGTAWRLKLRWEF